MKERRLLHRSPPRAPELHQATKMYELLPNKPNDLWQMDVTYIHIPGHGWWYAVTVIDYYSRYLLAVHLTASYSAAEVSQGIDLARAEAERSVAPWSSHPSWSPIMAPASSPIGSETTSPRWATATSASAIGRHSNSGL